MGRALKRLALVFHLNQLTGPTIRAAAAASYRPLLETLREHPDVPVHLHVSGCLLAGLPWYAPDVMDLLRQGVEAGQFELLGSTYAQSIPESSPPACSELSLSAHREQLDRMLAARPVGFWNPGRCYSEGYVGLVARAGYRYMLLETAVFDAAGLPTTQPARVRTVDEQSTLYLVPDSPRFRAAVNYAIWSGERRAIDEQVAGLPDDGLLVHAEDAEAFGLRGFERGFSPAAERGHLSRLLSHLPHLDGVELVHLGRLLETRPAPGAEAYEPGASPAPAPISSPGTHIKVPTVRGQSERMARTLADRNAPQHEVGYKSWFDFNARAPRLLHYRQVFQAVAGAFAAAVGELKAPLAPGARKLVERAREVFAASQFGFGRVGVGEMRWPAWELVRTSLLLLHAAARAATADDETAVARSHELDRDHDGVKELWLQASNDLVVVSPLGGRVLAWFELGSGEIIAGAALSLATPGPFRSAAHPYDGTLIEEPVWDPADPVRSIEAAASQAWYAREVAEHVRDLERSRVQLVSLAKPARPRTVVGLRRLGLFADEVDGKLVADAYEYELKGVEVRFRTPYGPKVVSVQQGRVACDYPEGFGGGAPVLVRCELLPDRRQRTLPSGPPLRVEAADTGLAVEVTSRPAATLTMWEELPLAWVAGLCWSPGKDGGGGPARIELARFP